MRSGLVVLLLALPACGPGVSYITRVTPGGGALLPDGRLAFVAEEWTPHQNGRLELIVCPVGTVSPDLVCERQYLVLGPPVDGEARAIAETRTEVLGAAAGALVCPRAEVVIQSGTASDGFWVGGCGRQRFLRLEAGAWVDRTP